MRTRNSYFSNNSSVTIPRRRNKRRTPNVVEPELRTIVEMADNRTMKELLQAPTEGYGEAIVILKINADHFEIKTNFIQLVQANPYHGYERENPHTHINNFKRITSNLKFRDVPNDVIKLMMFSYSLERNARVWYDKESSNSILTWEDLVNKFMNPFFPPSKTTHLKNKISCFTQRFEETFGEACERFKEILRACPYHGFTNLAQIDTFYNGLNDNDQDSLNATAGGNRLSKTTREALQIIENKSKVRYSRNKSNVSRTNTTSRKNSSKSDDRIDKLVDQISTLVDIFAKKVVAPAPVKAVEESCITYGGAHDYYNCLNIDSNQPSVCVATGTYNQVAAQNRASNYKAPPGFALNQSSTSGTLPSNTILNPKGKMKSITTRGGVAYDGPLIPTPKKSLLTNKDKLFKLAKIALNENCSAMLYKKLPEKLGDPGKFLIPCDFPGMDVCHALADLGARINLMPLSIWKKLSLPELTPTRMTLELTDRSITRPKGVFEDVFVKVGKFHFPIDFVVVDFQADPRVPLILGRSFLRTDRALIDVYGEEITLRVNDKAVTFNLNQTTRHSSTYDDLSVNQIDIIDVAREECEDTNLVLNWEKCHFMVKEGIILGHKISKNGLEVDRSKVDVIAKLPYPTTVKGVRSFLRHAGFYRQFIQDFSKIARPMTHLLKKETSFVFSKDCINPFEALKKKLTEALILVVPDWNLHFELMCDASDFAIGAVLGQQKTKHFQPIHYASMTMTKAQIHYTTTEKEMLAVMYAFEKFRPYIVLSKSIVYTDHSDLKYLLSKQDAKPRLIQRILLLQEFDIIIRDKKR
nr:reverse transcriptase domain-containing protein [Tanacetum cinerariifolium]